MGDGGSAKGAMPPVGFYQADAWFSSCSSDDTVVAQVDFRISDATI
jgi:hypothetical protein